MNYICPFCQKAITPSQYFWGVCPHCNMAWYSERDRRLDEYTKLERRRIAATIPEAVAPEGEIGKAAMTDGKAE